MTLALSSRRAVLMPGRWVSNELWRRARAVPSLDLRFAENKSLVDAISGQNLITFTRASSGTFVGSNGPIQTAANDVPRFTHDPVTGECLGLLVEEQRSNLLLNSETLSTQSVTVSATAYTLSFYGTGIVTLSGTSTAGPLVGTGASTRVSLTFTPTAGSLTLTVSGSVTNANLEAGSFATSWIPTTGTTATRSADLASITGAAFSSWYRQDEGTVFADAVSDQASGGTRFTVMLLGGTFNDRMVVGVASTNQYQTFYASNNIQQANLTTGVYTPSTRFKMSATYATNDVAHSVNGGSSQADASVTLMAPTQLFIGFAGAYFGGTIRRLTYWPARLPNSTLQGLTL